MKRRVRFVVLEGPDKSGKSSMMKLLTTRYEEFKELRVIPRADVIIKNSLSSFPSFFEIFENLDPSKVHVLDRFLMTDIAYAMARDIEANPYHHVELIKEFKARFDVLQVNLVRDPVEKDYKDDKIYLPKEVFNRLISIYGSNSPDYGYVWSRRVVDGSHFDRKAGSSLADDIAYTMVQDFLPIQYHYSSDPWRFFITCMLLNNTTGQMVRKVVREVFHHYPTAESLRQPRVAENLQRILFPLGMQAQRAERIVKFSLNFDFSSNYVFSRKEVEAMPGLGKYAADSYMAFVIRDRNPDHYAFPLDKVVGTSLSKMTEDSHASARFKEMIKE